MDKHLGFTALFAVGLVVGIVAMLTSSASAVIVTVNGATAFDSGGFESESVGTTPSSPTTGLGYQTVVQVNTVADPAAISNVEVIDSSGGPGAYLGENYLMLEKTAMINNRGLGTIMALDAPAVPGDVVVADFAFYMDSTTTEIVDDAWDLAAFFPFVRDLAGFHGHHHTWFGCGAQSQYNLDLEWIDWTGAAADDMFMAYHDGADWIQTTKADGSPFFVNFDQWHNISINLTVGQDYTVNIDGVTSAPMAADSTVATPDVVGLQAMVNGSTAAAGFYIDESSIVHIQLPGDANYDGIVNAADAAIVADNWQAGGANWGMGDFNDDTVVDDIDATILASNWQTGAAGSAAVPEPSTLALILAAMGMLFAKHITRRRNMQRFTTLLIVGLAVSIFAADAQAVQINNLTDVTSEFDSQGFENVAIGNAPLDIPAGGMIYRRIFGLANDDISVTGAAAGNPAAAEGDKYLMSNIDTPALGGQGSIVMGLENVVETFDNLVAEMAVYVDSLGQPLDVGTTGYASYPCFTFSKNYTGTYGNNHTWLTFLPVGDWSSANFDTTGIGENQMIIGYHSVDAGGWKNVTTAGGTQNMYADIDTWQNLTFDLTVGLGYTLDIDGVTSDMMAIDGAKANDYVQSFRVFNNDSSSHSRFYLDNISSAAGTSVPEPGTIALLLGSVVALLIRRRR